MIEQGREVTTAGAILDLPSELPEPRVPVDHTPIEDGCHPWRTFHCAHCGHPLRVQVSCGDRTCPKCRKKWYGYHYGNLKKYVSKWDRPKFLTLTLKNFKDGFYRSDVVRIRDCFSELRRRLNGKIVGGFYTIQVTNNGNGWHLHIHAIIHGEFIPQPKISELWHDITGDSYIVHIEELYDWRKGLRYVLADFLQSPRIRPEDMETFRGIFRGSRLVQGFGDLARVKLRVPFPCPRCGCTTWMDLDAFLGVPGYHFQAHREDSS